ncbi:hypothetical protein [Nocardia seriolae]|uniref:Cell wall-active antibiotics response LiaF-like C-terminal domain-containing protein n=1 Tax=Nocardia seriolae TaxID=37332 RepID=A0ABC9YVZ0_9NOCA|nr:hypothetical protein [Nocardia seriolae]BEK99249.1 hypothetical protein NSER024013_71550 [Nocardia seriolae]GAM47631.1 hypothetical protein NS07_v2contig00054-0030 [Nocardia seriolae]GAP29478.1 hypothetical protein NSK11_contig00057-0016 [Nocardia seriolae]
MTRTKEQRQTSAVRVDDVERMFGARRNQPAAEAPPLELRVNGGTKRTDDDWTVPKKLVADCVSGKLVVDFTRARCSRREIDIQVTAGGGTIVLIVPRGWRVDMDAVTPGGGTVSNRVKLPRFPGAPLIRVVGQVDTGTVKARYAYRSPLRRLRRS